MSTTPPVPTVTINVTAHQSHWKSIFDLIMKLAPLGSAVAANFTSPAVSQQIDASVQLAEQVEPIVIQIAGITSPATPQN